MRTRTLQTGARILRVVWYFYATATALSVGGITVTGYALGGAAYYDGWSKAMLDAQTAKVFENVTSAFGTGPIKTAFLVVYAPVFALTDHVFTGAARLGYATHSTLFANALALAVIVVGAYWAATTLADLFEGDEADA